jgi:hypothetical protein
MIQESNFYSTNHSDILEYDSKIFYVLNLEPVAETQKTEEIVIASGAKQSSLHNVSFFNGFRRFY